MQNFTITNRLLVFCTSLLLITLILSKNVVSAKKVNHYRSHYKSSLLADVESGRILYHDRMHQIIYPASLVKMMVSLIVLEEIDAGRISLQDSVKVSRWASKIGGHQVYLKEGEVFKLEELMKAIVISSANDASVAIAEYVSGKDKQFIKKMNYRAVAIGMKKTRFFSVHGLPPGRGQSLDESTAFDMYLLAMELLKHPQYLRWSSIRLDNFRNGTFQLLNTNHRLIRNYKGMDGMKTGYHRRAGFNLVSTAEREGQRFISIVMGAKNSRVRSKSVTNLLDYGFDNFIKSVLNKKDDTVPFFAKVEGGKSEKISLKSAETVRILLSSEELKRLEILPKIHLKTNAPVAAEQKLGTLEYWLDGNILKKVVLHAENAVPKQSILSKLTGMLTNLSDAN